MRKILAIFCLLLLPIFAYAASPLLTLRGQTQFYANDANAGPFDNTVKGHAAVYISSTNTYWFAWEAFSGFGIAQQRVVKVATYNATAKKWSGDWIAGTRTLTNDIHGSPTLVRDSSGYVYVFYGDHTSVVNIAVTTSPDNPTSWNDTQSFGTNVTFQRPFWVGSSLYLFYDTSGSGNGREEACAIVSATASSGVLTFGAPTNLFDLTVTSDGWCIPGGAQVVGTNFYFTFTWAPTLGSCAKANEYLAIYDTTTGNVSNYSGGTTVAPGSQPINKTSADSNFSIVTASNVSQPGLFIDGSNNAHVTYATGSSAPALKHIVGSSGSFGSATTIYTYPSAVNGCYVRPTTTADPINGVNDWFLDGTNPSNTVTTDWAGNLFKLNRSAGGSFGVITSVLQSRFGGFGLDVIDDVANSDGTGITSGADAIRIVTGEAPSGNTSFVPAQLRAYAYSDNGFISRWPGHGVIGTVARSTPAHVQGGDITNGSSSGTVAVTLGSTVGNGNAVCGSVLWVNVAAQTLLSVKDDKNNNYTVLDTLTDATEGTAAASFCAFNLTNNPKIITATFSAATLGQGLMVDEYSGVSAVDVHTAQKQTNPGTSANAVSSGSATTLFTTDLIYGVAMNANGSGDTITAGTNFTRRQFDTAFGNASEDLVQAAPGSIAATFTSTQGSVSHYMVFLMALER